MVLQLGLDKAISLVDLFVSQSKVGQGNVVFTDIISSIEVNSCIRGQC